jgi:glutathionyl-hydroquinone reductase
VAENPALDLYADALRSAIDLWNAHIYTAVNTAVFAKTLVDYQHALQKLFSALQELETHYRLNPSGEVSPGSALDFTAPHGRDLDFAASAPTPALRR